MFLMMVCAPRVCGDDPSLWVDDGTKTGVLPAYAGMIHAWPTSKPDSEKVLPAYAGMIPSPQLL